MNARQRRHAIRAEARRLEHWKPEAKRLEDSKQAIKRTRLHFKLGIEEKLVIEPITGLIRYIIPYRIVKRLPSGQPGIHTVKSKTAKDFDKTRNNSTWG